jgi:Protein of unknown function (DUF1566)
LSYTDNGDGTFTDNNTGLMWEIKLAVDDVGGNCADGTQENRSAHCVDNGYSWSITGGTPNANGTLFTVFLDDLNHTYDGAGVTPCTDDSECGAGVCGLVGYHDWRIPNVKELQGILDYSIHDPASSVPGSTFNANTWSATTNAQATDNAWYILFGSGNVNSGNKTIPNNARAVRP